MSSSIVSCLISTVTDAASVRPVSFLNARLFVTSSWSARSKSPTISASDEYPSARSSVVTGSFFLRSMYDHITFATSVETSIHEPRKGMTRAL